MMNCMRKTHDAFENYVILDFTEKKLMVGDSWYLVKIFYKYGAHIFN